MAPSVGRRLADAKQRFKGRQPLRFQLELTPYFADGIPSHIKRASFLWQRGPKLQYTSFSDTSTDGTVHWGDALTQTSTLYRSGNTFAQKEYSFKLQGVKGEGKDERPRTFAKAQIDLAAYCSCESSGTRDLIVELSPQGRVHVGVVTTWLKNSTPEQDSLTDLSYLSIGPSGPSSTLAGDQDLAGFEEHPAVKATPQKKVAFSHSLSMPVSKRPSRSFSIPAGGPPATGRELRSTKSSMTLLREDSTVLGTPALERTSRPNVQVDTPSFAGFQTVPLEERDLVTPTIPGRTRQELRANLHRKTKSEPVTPDVALSIPEDEPCSPPAPEWRSTDLEEAYSTLLSSESEDEGGAGPVASVRRWWTGGKPKRPQVLHSPFSDAAQGARVAELDAINGETDVEALRARCRALTQERDVAQEERNQLHRRVMRMDRDLEQMELAKKGMQERLAVSEDRLMRITRDDTMTSLVHAKLTLAQTDYDNLELQRLLTQERLRNQTLWSRLTHMENQYHATLDRISASALIPAHRNCYDDGQAGPVAMSCLPFGSGGNISRAKQLPVEAPEEVLPSAAPSPSLPGSPATADVADGRAEVAGQHAEVAHGNDVEEHGRIMLPVSTAVPVQS
ncbi:g4796 [Coccomyxa elongata]